MWTSSSLLLLPSCSAAVAAAVREPASACWKICGGPELPLVSNACWISSSVVAGLTAALDPQLAGRQRALHRDSENSEGNAPMSICLPILSLTRSL